MSEQRLQEFSRRLAEEEREPSTIRKYVQDAERFAVWLGERPVSREAAAEWKERLRKSGLRAETVNSKLSALNKLFAFAGWPEFRVK